jgi:hypothetical protein
MSQRPLVTRHIKLVDAELMIVVLRQVLAKLLSVICIGKHYVVVTLASLFICSVQLELHRELEAAELLLHCEVRLGHILEGHTLEELVDIKTFDLDINLLS